MGLEVKHLSFQYVKGRDVFRDVSFTLEEGEILSILGVNGAGKTTLLNCLAGLTRPKTGEITLDGQDLAALDRRAISRLVGYVPQIHSSSFAYSVLEYVVMGRAPYIAAYSTPSEEDYALARENIRRMGLEGKEQKVFTELSGGEQQLSTIARVLTQEPKLILFDEPTNHLDFGNQYRTLNMMTELAGEGYGIISTTHNPDHALRLGGSAAILDARGSIRVGKAEEMLTPEHLSTLYDMDIRVLEPEPHKGKICYVSSTLR